MPDKFKSFVFLNRESDALKNIKDLRDLKNLEEVKSIFSVLKNQDKELFISLLNKTRLTIPLLTDE